MDAIKYLKEQARLCRSINDCSKCPLNYDHLCSDISDDGLIDRKIMIVETWSKAHPQKSRMSEFLKQYPNAPMGDDGLPVVSPCNLDPKYYERQCGSSQSWISCSDCRKEYWLKEIE